MIGLGIESTAHTLGIGIIKDGKIIANEKDSYVTKEGGIIPMDAAKHHEDVFDKILRRVLRKTRLRLGTFNFIAISIGPGLAPCLLIGLKKAKQLCKKFELPLIGVNHCVAHLEIGRLTGVNDPVMLYASGANTQIIAYEAGKYRVFGETLDIGVGNFIDTFARYAGIGFPGGPVIEKLAQESKKYIELPYKVKGMDVAFSGILTNLRQKLEKINSIPTPPPSKRLVNSKSHDTNYSLSDLAYSMQETVFAMLVETAERALAHTGKKELLLGGGVACNSRLQEMCKIMCKERGAKFFCPERSLLVDNAAMIAFLGEIMFNSLSLSHPPTREKKINKTISKLIYFPKDLDKIDIMPRQRTDEVEVSWK